MLQRTSRALRALPFLALAGCAAAPSPGAAAVVAPSVEAAGPRAELGVRHAPMAEVVEDFAALFGDEHPAVDVPAVRLERVSAGVPWPRGLAWVDDRLVVLARGRHRNAGGVDRSIQDHTGSLFVVDPAVAEEVEPGGYASARVSANATVLAAATGEPHHLPDPKVEPIRDTLMDRPYCTLIWDEASRNLFICGYSGVDLPGRRFRKNATDSILRYDLRSERWYPVELHDPSVVPQDEMSWVVPNAYYPHHDPATNPAPHGWLNGPDGGCVVGDWLYCVAKDNHLLVRYDLREVRRDPDAGFPESEVVLGPRVTLRTPQGLRETELLGASAAAVHEGHLYVGYRTSSVVARYPLREDGSLVRPVVGELVAMFEPWDAEAGRSANVIDIAFNSKGELFVSCASESRIWKVGVPDPERPFRGDTRGGAATSAPPYADLAALTGRSTGSGNLLFDPEDRLYVCAGAYDTASSRVAGAVYRVVEVEGS